MSSTATLAFFGALAGGLYVAYIDFHATEVQASLLVILLITFVLGVVDSQRAWLWALVIAFCLAGSHWLAPRFGVFPRDGGNIGNPFSLLVVAIPGLISAYLGAGLRWMYGRLSH